MFSNQQLQAFGWNRRTVALYGPLTRAVLTSTVIVLTTAQVVAFSRVAMTTVTVRHMQDFGLFYGAARRVLIDRANPYEDVVLPGGMTSVNAINLNPPHFVLLMLPFGVFRPEVALALWAVASLCSAAAAIRIIFRELRFPLSLSVVGWTVVALAYAAPTGALLLTAQVSWLLWWPTTWAWAAARQGRWTRAAVAIGMIASLKPFVGLFVPFLAIAGQWRACAVATVVAVGCLMLGFVGLGWAAFTSWLVGLQSVTWAPQIFNASVAGVLQRLFTVHEPLPAWNLESLAVAPHIVRPLWAAAAILIVGVSSWAVARDRSAEGVDRLFAVVLVSALLISPLGWIYYEFLLVGPVLALCVIERWWAGPAWRQLLLVSALVTGALSPGTLSAPPPGGWATLSIGSAYFWGLLALWICTVLAPRSSGSGRRSATVEMPIVQVASETQEVDEA